jgi:hypothetical protein
MDPANGRREDDSIAIFQIAMDDDEIELFGANNGECGS